MNIEVLECPKWAINKRDLESIFSRLSENSGEKVSLVFRNNVFKDSFNFTDFFQDIDIKFDKIIFEDVTFKEYVRFIDLQCDELEFLYVKFEKGGALKNRNGAFGLDIKNLTFRPFQVENDFVIDIGNYANSQGLLETEKVGRIQNIEFENHKDGKGQVYFVGINKYTEKADFKNKVLDNVSFQNCDLSNCYFLNAKVDKAEFRNCAFPEIRNQTLVNKLDSKSNVIFFILFTFLMPIAFGLVLNSYSIDSMWIFTGYFFMVPFMMFLWLASFNATMHPIEYFFSGLFIGKKQGALNKVENFHHHFGVKDEEIINNYLNEYNIMKSINSVNERNRLQESYFNLIELYRQLKENFDKSDFQTAGNFFYAQRYIEMISTTRKKSSLESWVLNIHYMVNGFGERFMRPLILLIATIVLFTLLPIQQTNDYIATNNTPRFLLQLDKAKQASSPILMDQNQTVMLQIQNDKQNNFYLDKKMDNNATISFTVPKLKEDWHTAFYYSLSHYNVPFVLENRQWFQEVSERAIFWGWVERGLLWLFSGAFVLAVFHRIRR